MDWKPFLETHCIDCHDAEMREGGLDLTELTENFGDRASLASWIRIHDRVRDGEMPPAKVKIRPNYEEVTEFSERLGGAMIDFLSQRQAREGRVISRRLSRVEYERAMHELLGVRVPLMELLPEDPKTGGFDRIAEGQPLSPVLLERYLEAAEVALDAAVALLQRGKSHPVRKYGVPDLVKASPWFYGGPPDEFSDCAAVWNYLVSDMGGGKFYGRLPATTLREAGWYRVSVRARALNPPNGHVWGALHRGQCDSSAPQMLWIGWLDLTEVSQEFTFETWMEPGEMLHLRPVDDTTAWRGRKRDGDKLVLANGKQPMEMGIPGIAIEAVEIRRLANGLEPEQIQSRLFAGRNPPETMDQIREDILHLAQRAWRCPVRHLDIEPALSLAEVALSKKEKPLTAWRAAVMAVLTSPRFLFYQERPGSLDEHALAARLSSFLWSLPPDDALLAAASSGVLHRPEELRKQTERLLDDPRAQHFVSHFVDQWLKLDEIDFTVPDQVLYPEYDEILKHSMLGETRAFFAELLKRDLSVRMLAKSDFAMLNGRLAAHYGVAGPTGLDFEKVVLPPDSVRGGLFGQAAILKVTANGTATSPVLRGVWVLERVLGKHVPLPPPNVGSVEPDIRGAKTIREQLDKHRNAASCAACHRHIDPPGFALESFDPIGGWRERYRAISDNEKKKQWTAAAPVDASGVLPDDNAFDDIRQFRTHIASDPATLARAVAAQLVAYGTGAPVSFADRAEIEAIVTRAASRDHGFRSILHEIIQSPLFLHK